MSKGITVPPPTITDVQLAAIQKKNKENIKSMHEGDSIAYVCSDAVLLIGDRHLPLVERIVRAGPFDHGVITIKKGSAFNSGQLTVSGSRHHPWFEHAIAAFSSKKVTWV
jgi:hypothetical protein